MHNYQQPNLKKNKNKNELSNQPKQEEIPRNGNHMEGHQQGGVGGKMGEKVQGI